MEILATIPTIRHSKQPGIPLCTTKCSGAFPGCPPGAGKDFGDYGNPNRNPYNRNSAGYGIFAPYNQWETICPARK